MSSLESEMEHLVNPARAGMIPLKWAARMRPICKPRASGDDPTPITELVGLIM